jgi:hypothetical protein
MLQSLSFLINNTPLFKIFRSSRRNSVPLRSDFRDKLSVLANDWRAVNAIDNLVIQVSMCFTPA